MSRPALIAVWGAVGLILLISCANVAHLILARSAANARDAAIRSALGANTAQLVRQSLAESLALSLAGGLLGLLIASAAMPVLRVMAAGQIPRIEDVALNSTVFLFSLALVIACGGLFAIVPAINGTRVCLNDVLKAGSGSVSRRRWAGQTLAIVETALALTVLIGAALLLRSYANVLAGDPGFQPGHLLTFNLSLPQGPVQFAEAYRNALAPRFARAARSGSGGADQCCPGRFWTNGAQPLCHSFRDRGTDLPARATSGDPVALDHARSISTVMKIHLKRGRLLTAADDNQPVFVINETLARQYFPGQDAVGHSLVMNVDQPGQQAARIVGLVNDVKEFGLDAAAPPVIYSVGYSGGMVVLRTAGDPAQACGSGPERGGGGERRMVRWPYANDGRHHRRIAGAEAIRAMAAGGVRGARGGAGSNRNLWRGRIFGGDADS